MVNSWHARFHAVLHLLAILLVIAYLAPFHQVVAQEDQISELIDLINGLRASKGLAPYIVDPGLMTLAQEHSAYQAAIHTSTHLHSDGRTPPQIGVVENVAGGDIGYIDPQTAVYVIWADPVHGRTMIGYSAGSMGVGIADDGTTAYYTLEVRPAGNSTAPGPGTSRTRTPAVPLTPIPFATLVPATPQSDGSIVHIVGYGQTLWAIALAYGIRIEQIRAWNNIPADSTELYVGQRLLVRPANMVKASPTLPTEPGPQPTKDIMISTLTNTVEGTSTTTPSPSNTPTISDIAGSRPTGTGTQDVMPASSNDTRAEPGLLAPILAGGCILLGCALMLILRINKQPS